MNNTQWMSHANACTYLYGDMSSQHKRLTSYYLEKWVKKVKKNPFDARRKLYWKPQVDALKLWLTLPMGERNIKANREKME